MKFNLNSEVGQAMLALDKAGGTKLTAALRAGYSSAARVIRDKAKLTTAFKDRTGTARRSWKVSQRASPFNHAKLSNTAFYTMFIEGEPMNTGFLERAAHSTGGEQLKVVKKAVLRHLERLRAVGPK